MRKINKLIIHHSAYPMKKTTWPLIKEWHLKRGFNDIGYHYGIDSGGQLFKGRDESVIGAHCKGQNKNSLGVCVFGDFTKEEPTNQQLFTLFFLLEFLTKRHKLLSIDVHSHKDYGNTLCPGYLEENIENYRGFGIL